MFSLFNNERVLIEPTDIPSMLRITYCYGPFVFSGNISREPTEVEKLREEVANLRSQLATSVETPPDLENEDTIPPAE